MRILLAVCLVFACGPKGPRYKYPQRPCAESQQARAAGRSTPTNDDALRAYDTFASSCKRVCETQDDLAHCAELGLLGADAYGILSGIEPLTKYCEAGNQPACDWVAANQEAIEFWRTYTPEHGPFEDEVGQPSGGDVTTLGGFVSAFEQDAASRGYQLVSETSYDLADGYAGVELSLISGTLYQIAVIGSPTTTFTADLGGASGLVFAEAPRNDYAYVRVSGVDYEVPGTAWLNIRADGGDRGTVWVVIHRTN